MFKMTKEKALKIQSDQVAFYSKYLPNLAELVAAETQADKLEDGKEYSVVIINQYIPRGGSIESILARHTNVRFSGD